MILLALSMAFMTVLIVANVVATKIIGVGPVSVGGWELGPWSMSAGVVAYPLTFLLSDTVSEVYGRRAATRMVWLGFAFSLLMMALVWLANILPSADFYEGQQAFSDTLGSVPRIVAASMIAYLVAQNQDVITFHLWRRWTKGRHLWLRNNASTALSQLTDTALFTTIAFAGVYAGGELFEIFSTEYVAKLAIAAVDTPLVYALVGLVRRYENQSGMAPTEAAA